MANILHVTFFSPSPVVIDWNRKVCLVRKNQNSNGQFSEREAGDMKCAINTMCFDTNCDINTMHTHAHTFPGSKKWCRLHCDQGCIVVKPGTNLYERCARKLAFFCLNETCCKVEFCVQYCIFHFFTDHGLHTALAHLSP